MMAFFKKSILVLLIIEASLNTLYCQSTTNEVTLTFRNYLEQVRTHHPIAQQASIQIDLGDAQVLSARGNFDPVIYADMAQKYFKGNQYYHLMNGGLKIPTWFGIELYAGYENNRGSYLNSQNTLPDGGIAYAGLSVPIGKDLIIDKRRAQLRKAQIYQTMSYEERRLIMNDLIFEASEAYLNWFQAYGELRAYTEAYNLAMIRFNAIKRSVDLGDAALIDTLESFVQLQNREISMEQAKLDFINSKSLVSIYLWQDGIIPVELSDLYFPPLELDTSLDENPYIAPSLDPENALNNHPEIIYAQLKIDQLNIEKRLAIEKLKPQLNLKYNAINEPLGSNPFVNYSLQNYSWGADFKMPILLRNGRGELKISQLSILDATLGLESKKASIQMKFNQARNEWYTTLRQVEIYRQTVDGLEKLYRAEDSKFFLGESSVFMINTRETNFISAKVKQIELTAKNQKSLMKTYHCLGMLK